MKRLILALTLIAFAAPLGGCFETFQAINGFAVTQGELDGARNAYDGTALPALAGYARLPRCAKGTAFSINNRCHDAALLKRFRDDDVTVADAFNKVQDAITSGNNSGALAAWNTLQNALAIVKKIIADNNLTAI